MYLAALFLSRLLPPVPRWALSFEPTDAERDEADRAFGEAPGVLPIAQLQISREPDGYTARRPTWEYGCVRARTLTELAERLKWNPKTNFDPAGA